MKQKILTSYLLFSFCLVIIADGQKPVYPIPAEDLLQLKKKTLLPLANSENSVNRKLEHSYKHFPQASFDEDLQRVKVVTADPRYGTVSADAALAQDLSLSARTPVSTSTCFRLTKDINTSTGYSNPSNFPVNGPYAFAVLNNVSYFSADDGLHGRELWRSDGTATGTYMVKDIHGGSSWSNPSGIIAVNGLLYFSAESPGFGSEPWVSDGTELGTHILKDVDPYFSNPNQFTNVGGLVYFVASSQGYNNQLWKTNGTEVGTELVKDISYSDGYYIQELTAVNNTVFFIANTYSSGFQLFRSDGTEHGTYMVKQIGYYYQSDYVAPMQLTSYDNKLYFSVDDGSGRRLWSSDGTETGTNYAAGFNDVFLDQNFLNIFSNRSFPILNNVLYFAGNTLADGGGLYKYDASNTDGIVLVKDLATYPGNAYGIPPDMLVINNLLYFKVINDDIPNHDELWVSDGGTSGTAPIKVFPAGEYFYSFCNVNGSLFFVKSDPANGNELWKTNGTGAGTVIVKDIFPGGGSSYPDNLTFCNGKLLFRAVDNLTGGELWSSNGSAAGTTLVKDINSATTDNSYAGLAYKGISTSGTGVMFGAFTPEKGYELYKSDGTTAGTVLLNEITAGDQWSYPNSFIYKNGFNYFIGDNAVGTTIYRSNGTPAGLKKIVYDIDRSIYYVTNFNITDNALPFYILGYRNSYAFELWRSDGTPSGTYKLASSLLVESHLVTSGNTVYFIASDDTHGVELWKSDGTIAGTKMVKDIQPGAAGSYPYSLFVYKKEVYFGAYDGMGLNYQLWKSNGTEKGTVKLKNITPARYDYVSNPDVQVFCISDNILYFSATDMQTYGAELWKSNGTSNGTTIVKDINLQGYAYPNFLNDLNGTLYFTADDGIKGTELWSSRGTASTTKMVKDITPDYSSYLYNFCAVGNKLYFQNATDGGRLWSSDGTANNTNVITDPVLTQLSDFGRLVNGAGKLFFGATSPTYGVELFVGDICATTTTAARPGVSKPEISIPDLAVDAFLYPNPSSGAASLRLGATSNNVIVTITDISGKTYWQRSFNNASQVDLPTEQLAKGLYMVTVKSSGGSKSLKFIKQ